MTIAAINTTVMAGTNIMAIRHMRQRQPSLHKKETSRSPIRFAA